MSNYATAPVELEQPGVDPVYLTRDDLARTLQPINSYECMLVTVSAQAWHQLQHARDLEAQVFAHTRPFDLFSSHLDRFQAITRYVANSDRAWRQATAAFEHAKRNRPPRPILRPHTTPQSAAGLQNEANRTPAQPAHSETKPNAGPATLTRPQEPDRTTGSETNPARGGHPEPSAGTRSKPVPKTKPIPAGPLASTRPASVPAPLEAGLQNEANPLGTSRVNPASRRPGPTRSRSPKRSQSRPDLSRQPGQPASRTHSKPVSKTKPIPAGPRVNPASVPYPPQAGSQNEANPGRTSRVNPAGQHPVHTRSRSPKRSQSRPDPIATTDFQTNPNPASVTTRSPKRSHPARQPEPAQPNPATRPKHTHHSIPPSGPAHF